MILIKKMQMKHVDRVYEIEESSFAVPWTKKDFYGEVRRKNAYYLVAVDDATEYVAGYGGLWHIVNEGHINNIAVDENYRRMGIGSLLVEGLIRLATNKKMIGLTLEVRMGNLAAYALYAKHGFKIEGIRKNYYSEPKEDAIIMWKKFNTEDTDETF
ncbi:MAG: ribosomal protein S18-alanine N-acetyltransferase [Defluviitaleaceae bacterium]|nr:ribosomal protein S18-alanine N-acetyltransferase [Defluviitaleaceae bacterium]